MIVLALGTMMVSCGGGADAAREIKVADLKDPCGCAEAALQVMEVIQPHFAKLKDLKTEEEIEAYVKDNNLDGIEDKMFEIEDHCREMDEPGDDCAAAKKLQELKSKQ